MTLVSLEEMLEARKRGCKGTLKKYKVPVMAKEVRNPGQPSGLVFYTDLILPSRELVLVASCLRAVLSAGKEHHGQDKLL